MRNCRTMVPTERMKAHITVCVCTYRRPLLLARLLQELCLQETNDLFSYSMVVADNDAQRSAEETVMNFASSSAIPITYCCESKQNIALARNRAIVASTGDYIAFIDDDEFPVTRW